MSDSAKRRRISQACENCRRRKSRCEGVREGQTSCANCQAANQVCHFSHKSNRTSRAEVQALEEQLEVYRELLGETSSDARIRAQSPKVTEDRTVHVRPGARKGAKWKDTVCYLGDSSPVHIMPILVQGQKKNARANNLPPILFGAPACLTEIPSGDRHIGALRLIALDTWPEPELESQLVDAFFTFPHRTYPLLGEEQFRAQLLNDKCKADRDWLALAFALFAVASRFTEPVTQSQQDSENTCESIGASYYRACRLLSCASEWNASSLVHIQTTLLMVIYLMGTQLGYTVAWNFLGAAARMLQSVGAHRNFTARHLDWSAQEAQAWNRAWWVTYTLDREQSSIYGRPLMLRDDDADLPLPQRPSSFLAGIKLDEIIGRTLVALYAPRARFRDRSAFDVLKHFELSLKSWQDKEGAISLESTNETDGGILVEKAMLSIKFHFCQLLIYRHSSQTYMSNVLEAAQCIVRIANDLLQRNLLSYGGHLAGSRTVEAVCVLLNALSHTSERDCSVANSVAAGLKALRVLGQRWTLAERLTELLETLCTEMGVARAEPGNSRREGLPPQVRRSFQLHHDRTQEAPEDCSSTIFDALCPGWDSWEMPSFSSSLLQLQFDQNEED